jgi:soluble lytic murein transglycosylase-like protein/TolA-binding protein
LLLWSVAAGAAEPTLAEAMALGDCATVIRLAEGAPGGAPRLAAARCHLRGDRPDLALTALGEPAGPLAGYQRLLAAEASLEAKDVDGALAALDGVSLPGPAGNDVRLLRGRLKAERGDGAAAADLDALAKTDLGSEAQYYGAVLARERGDAAGEVAALKALWLDARPGGWDDRAAARLADLGHEVPELGSAAGRALARKRLQALHDRMRAAEAKTLADRLAALEPPSTSAQWKLLGRARYNARDYVGAVLAWRQVFGLPEVAAGDAEGLFDYALVHARAGDYGTAAVVYRRVMAQHAKTSQGDFASFKLGYMKYDRGECAEAVPLFREHEALHPQSKHLDEALWFTARCAWKAGDRPAAAAAWEALEAKRPKSSLVPGAAYWRARAKGLDGDAAGETAGLKKVVSSWPTSGYAWFAAERLGRTFPPVPAAEVPPWPASLREAGEVVRAEALLSAGLRRWAQGELDALSVPDDRGAQLALGWALLRAGDVLGAKRIGCRYDAPVWEGGDPVAQQLCYPRPEVAVVERHTVGLDPSVVYGVMLAESALDPAVSSAVGARGLMQLMPYVASDLHGRVFGARPFDADDLFSAPYNAALGCTELSDRAKSLSGTLAPSAVPATVASYNGGEEAVRRWIGGLSGSPPASDEFAEDIGYVETRGYVKRVLGFAMSYRWVYGDG